jgi:hypothetical protein
MLSWIRNLLGIRKDLIDTSKAKIETLKAELEVDKLEDEASERHLITRATLDDVKKYDAKNSLIEEKIKEEYQKQKFYHAGGCSGISLVTLILTGLLIGFLIMFFKELLSYLLGW